jgi:putative sterol carrier protein
MSVADEVKEIFNKMPEAFIAEKAAGIKATIQIELSGDGGGSWALSIIDGQILVKEDKAISPDLTLSMDAADYLALSRGEANPMALFQAGKIKLQGNMTLALKFQEMFNRNR